MAENSKIEWTDNTFNPWIGCQKVSAGCDFCYAETLMDHRYKRVTWGPHGERIRTSAENWKLPARWNKAAAASGRRTRVFCASLADWLDNKAQAQWRDDLARLIEATPHLDWLLLTKRIENFGKLGPWLSGSVPVNVWLGVTCEDQAAFDRRWPILAKIDCAVRFISYEPAIGPLVIGQARPSWVICGGESGTTPRMMRPDWAYALRAECEKAGVAFFMKQMTGKEPIPSGLLLRQFPKTTQREGWC